MRRKNIDQEIKDKKALLILIAISAIITGFLNMVFFLIEKL